MLMHEICGYPVNVNDSVREPLRLLVHPGKASPQEIADFLSSMSELAQMMGIEGGIRWEVSGRTLNTTDRESAKNFPEIPNLSNAFKPICHPNQDVPDLGVDFYDH